MIKLCFARLFTKTIANRVFRVERLNVIEGFIQSNLDIIIYNQLFNYIFCLFSLCVGCMRLDGERGFRYFVDSAYP